MSNKNISRPTDPDFKLDNYPLYNLNRTAATYTNEMSVALKSIEMDQTQWRVLGILGDKNNSTVTEIARRSVIKMSTLTRMMERMEADGLIIRTPWPEDKRIIKVSITAQGRKALKRALNVGASVYDKAFENISEADIEHLMRTLKAVRENLSRNQHQAAA